VEFSEAEEELPVEQPTKFELIINAKAAHSQGVVMPKSLLLRADQVFDERHVWTRSALPRVVIPEHMPTHPENASFNELAAPWQQSASASRLS
jgi:hypothetical protein